MSTESGRELEMLVTVIQIDRLIRLPASIAKEVYLILNAAFVLDESLRCKTMVESCH